MNQPRVCVVIVNWNRWDDTAICVDSLLAMTYDYLDIVVVDNHSKTNGEEAFRNRWPNVEIIHTPINLGFAGGANAGIRHALARNADFIFTLNNDTLVDPYCLTELLAVAASDSTIGIVGPKIYYRTTPPRIWFAGANRHRWSLSLLNFGRGQPDGSRFDEARRVNYLCAGAMLVRRSVFEIVGLFDSGYFMYYEDCDFCIRTSTYGYDLQYVPSAKVWHQVAASTGGEGSPMEVYYRTCSVFRFIWQHSRGLHRTTLVGLRIVYVLAQAVHQRLAGHASTAMALWRGLCDGWANMTHSSEIDEGKDWA